MFNLYCCFKIMTCDVWELSVGGQSTKYKVLIELLRRHTRPGRHFIVLAISQLEASRPDNSAIYILLTGFRKCIQNRTKCHVIWAIAQMI